MRYLYLLFFPLMACHKITCTPLLLQTKGFVLSDTLYNVGVAFEEYDSYAFYPVYYNGRMHDTIGIPAMFMYGAGPKEYPPAVTYEYAASALELFVDTSVKTKIGMVHFADGEWKEIDSVMNTNAYLLTIKNIADSTIFICNSYLLHNLRSVYREVKNNKGEWIRIEERAPGGCISTGVISVKPGEVIISKVRRCKGNVMAPCRIVLDFFRRNKAYSNTFMDNVDPCFPE